MENSMWTIEKMKIKKNIVNNFHLLTESQRFPNMLGQPLYNMLGQRLYNMLGQRLYNMLGQRLYNMLGQHFLDEQSEDGFASRNQRLPNKNCSLKPNVGPTSTCYLGYQQIWILQIFSNFSRFLHRIFLFFPQKIKFWTYST